MSFRDKLDFLVTNTCNYIALFKQTVNLRYNVTIYFSIKRMENHAGIS